MRDNCILHICVLWWGIYSPSPECKLYWRQGLCPYLMAYLAQCWHIADTPDTQWVVVDWKSEEIALAEAYCSLKPEWTCTYLHFGFDISDFFLVWLSSPLKFCSYPSPHIQPCVIVLSLCWYQVTLASFHIQHTYFYLCCLTPISHCTNHTQLLPQFHR